MQATDKGTPRRSATTTIQIQVTDVNDNAPVFLPLEAVHIAESKCDCWNHSFDLFVISRSAQPDIELTVSTCPQELYKLCNFFPGWS